MPKFMKNPNGMVLRYVPELAQRAGYREIAEAEAREYFEGIGADLDKLFGAPKKRGRAKPTPPPEEDLEPELPFAGGDAE